MVRGLELEESQRRARVEGEALLSACWICVLVDGVR